ncbi:hypothetical protein TWF696_007741 [Orbilia brochopaga]|uniref:Uncharacterized protein n=1 Tax=Orbilia brochopaga TaxID=3140254 RepID=A0AAV9UM77_9PEZI
MTRVLSDEEDSTMERSTASMLVLQIEKGITRDELDTMLSSFNNWYHELDTSTSSATSFTPEEETTSKTVRRQKTNRLMGERIKLLDDTRNGHSCHGAILPDVGGAVTLKAAARAGAVDYQ